MLKEKKVIIAGGSEGIGEQVAYFYARYGARVLVAARTESKLSKVVEKCRKVGNENGIYVYHAADLSDPEAGNDLIKVAQEKLGGVDILVLNHICGSKPDSWHATAENISVVEHSMKVNFLSYVRLASAAMDSLRRSHGSLIVMSSFAGRIPTPYVEPYAASKFALDGFFGGLRQQFAINNVDISVTMCYIGLTSTANAIEGLKQFKDGVILKTVQSVTPQAVADAVVRAGVKRQNFMYYPFYGRLAVVGYSLFPSLTEYFLAAVYSD